MAKIDITPIEEVQRNLIQENNALREELQIMQAAGIIEVAVRNPSVMEYMQHWEERAEKAEAELAKVREVNEAQARNFGAAMERIGWRDETIAQQAKTIEYLTEQLQQAQQRRTFARSGE